MRNSNEKYHTGYVEPNIEYPKQPQKLTELENIAVVQVFGKQAYPLRRICEALGYTVIWNDGIITVKKAEECHIIHTKDNAELQIIDGKCYAASSVFYSLFGISFRYFGGIGVLGIFK